MKLASLCAVLLGAILACPLRAAPVSQVPLQVASGAPGNLLLLPSSAEAAQAAAANPSATYSAGERYIGYFDPDKCYVYRRGEAEAERYFQPLGPALAHVCRQAWSGNFLNWATAQTIDVYRAVLTGGDRFLDSAAEGTEPANVGGVPGSQPAAGRGGWSHAVFRQ